MLYMRGNNGAYDATYLAENTQCPRPYRRGYDANGNPVRESTIFVPIVWQMNVEDLQPLYDSVRLILGAD
jgi:hypothetical protein